jgi:hypothetical protein
MSVVYKNTFGNTAATGAFDSSDGLFFDRVLSEFLPPKISITWDET